MILTKKQYESLEERSDDTYLLINNTYKLKNYLINPSKEEGCAIQIGGVVPLNEIPKVERIALILKGFELLIHITPQDENDEEIKYTNDHTVVCNFLVEGISN